MATVLSLGEAGVGRSETSVEFPGGVRVGTWVGRGAGPAVGATPWIAYPAASAAPIDDDEEDVEFEDDDEFDDEEEYDDDLDEEAEGYEDDDFESDADEDE